MGLVYEVWNFGSMTFNMGNLISRNEELLPELFFKFTFASHLTYSFYAHADSIDRL